MLDPRLIRNEITDVAERLKIKRFDLDVSAITQLDEQRKSLQVKTESLLSEKNSKSKSIGEAKGRGEDIEPLLENVSSLGKEIDGLKNSLEQVQGELRDILLTIPNLPDPDVPAGETEDENLEVRTWGDVPEFSFDVKDHVDLAADSAKLSFDVAAKITGTRFVSMRGVVLNTFSTF